jgi:hypothetical protein
MNLLHQTDAEPGENLNISQRIVKRIYGYRSYRIYSKGIKPVKGKKSSQHLQCVLPLYTAPLVIGLLRDQVSSTNEKESAVGQGKMARMVREVLIPHGTYDPPPNVIEDAIKSKVNELSNAGYKDAVTQIHQQILAFRHCIALNIDSGVLNYETGEYNGGEIVMEPILKLTCYHTFELEGVNDKLSNKYLNIYTHLLQMNHKCLI